MANVKKYLETGKALQKKYDEIKLGMVERAKEIEEQYKPITRLLREPPRQQNRLQAPPPPRPQIKAAPAPSTILGPIAHKYLGYKLSKDKGTESDTTFGIYTKGEDNKFYIDNTPLTIRGDSFRLGNNSYWYKGTPGLWALLTLKNPTHYTAADLREYGDILMLSNAYRRQNEPSSLRIKASKGSKYNTIIKPILQRKGVMGVKEEEEEEEEPSTSGTGLRKIQTNNPVEYVYWNTLEELLERLYIVYGEMKAGNTNPNLFNELVNILQEIREIQ